MKAETPNMTLSSTTFADSEVSLKNTAYPRNPFINRIDQAFALGRFPAVPLLGALAAIEVFL